MAKSQQKQNKTKKAFISIIIFTDIKIEKIVLDCMDEPNLNRRKLSLAGSREVQAKKLLRVGNMRKI